jgi:hypothetical protein
MMFQDLINLVGNRLYGTSNVPSKWKSEKLNTQCKHLQLGGKKMQQKISTWFLGS